MVWNEGNQNRQTVPTLNIEVTIFLKYLSTILGISRFTTDKL